MARAKPPAKKPPTKKAPARKAPAAKKPPAKKPTAKKAPAKKPPTKKPPARKAPTAKKPPARKAPTAKKAPAKKAPTRRTVTRPATGRPPAAAAGPVCFPPGEPPLVPLAFGRFDPHLAGSTIDRIERVTAEALRRSQRVWKWLPPAPLRIDFHASKTKRGFFQINRTRGGTVLGPPYISLSYDMLRHYDDASVLRTVVHELCHYRRDTLFPPDKARRHHDPVFCEELARIDAIVAADRRTCRLNGDEPKQGAALEVTDGEVEIRHARNGRELAFIWRPKRGDPETIVGNGAMVSFFRRFPPGNLTRLRVVNRWTDGHTAETNGLAYAHRYTFKREGKPITVAGVLKLPPMPAAPPRPIVGTNAPPTWQPAAAQRPPVAPPPGRPPVAPAWPGPPAPALRPAAPPAWPTQAAASAPAVRSNPGAAAASALGAFFRGR